MGDLLIFLYENFNFKFSFHIDDENSTPCHIEYLGVRENILIGSPQTIVG